MPAEKGGRAAPSFRLMGKEACALCAEEPCSTLHSMRFVIERLFQRNTTSQVMTRTVYSGKGQFQ